VRFVADILLAVISKKLNIGDAGRIKKYAREQNARFQSIEVANGKLALNLVHRDSPNEKVRDGDTASLLTTGFRDNFTSLRINDQRVIFETDPFGRSCFYYRQMDQHTVLLGRGLPSVLLLRSDDASLDVTAIVDRFMFGVPAYGLSYIEGVSRVGWQNHRLIIAEQDGHLRVTESPSVGKVPKHGNLTPDEFSRRMVANIGNHPGDPCLIMLSGGLDSALIGAAISDRFDDGNLAAFTFGQADSDDAILGKETAEELGLKHHTLEPEIGESLALLPSSVFASEQPVGSPVLPSVMKRAKNLADIIVTGEGADQVFGGSWFNRRDEMFVSELVSRFERLKHSLPIDDAFRFFEIIRRFAIGEPHERRSRIWEFELEGTLPFRSINTIAGHAHYYGMSASFPYLDASFIETIRADKDKYLVPFGWKPWLRRVAAPALLPSAVVGKILDQAKRPPGIAVKSVLKQLNHELIAAMPDSWSTAHPIKRLGQLIGEGVAEYQMAMFDLFSWIFILNGGDELSSEVDVADLYRDPSVRRELLVAYDPISQLVAKAERVSE
jgi:asparagine synthase